MVYSKNPELQFNWVDISSSGTPLNLGDDSYFYPIPFSFDFYGTAYDGIAISSNGAVQFEAVNVGFVNQPIPTSSPPAPLIAPFWDDLNPSVGGEIYYEIQGSRLIVQWDNLHHYGHEGSEVTVQLILDQSNSDILMQYLV